MWNSGHVFHADGLCKDGANLFMMDDVGLASKLVHGIFPKHDEIFGVILKQELDPQNAL